jgi:hypothetical protein
LPRKLGLKPGMRVLAMNPPAHFRALLADAPADLAWLARVAPSNCAVAFAKSAKELLAIFTKLEPKLAQDGMIWIAWPKKAAGIHCLLTDANGSPLARGRRY